MEKTSYQNTFPFEFALNVSPILNLSSFLQGLFQKASYSAVPSDSEASQREKEETPRLTARGDSRRRHFGLRWG